MSQTKSNNQPRLRWLFLIVVTIIAAILLGAHYSFYRITVALFGLDSGPGVNLYFWIMMALAISFPVSNLLVVGLDSFLTRAYYFLSALWIGAFFYLLLGAVVAGIVSLLSIAFGQTPLPHTIALLIMGISVLVIVVAYRNAMVPQVKTIRVTIAGLPEIWRKRSVVFISDIHLGAILRSGFLQRVVSRIDSLNPDLVLIGGDLFDGGGSNMNKLLEPLDQLQPELGIYMITGNHETYIHQQAALEAINSTRIRLLQNEYVEIDGLQLAGVEYPAMGEKSDPEEMLQRLDRNKPTILMFHEPRRVELFKKYGVNLHLAGHTHRGQIWPFNHITRLVYKGLDYGLHTDGEFNLYCSCGVGTWGPPFRTMSRSEIVLLELCQS